MCGILARISAQPPRDHAAQVSAQRFQDALRLMRSRGPDGHGVWSCPATNLATLGHRRLAIQDRSPAGHQPMLSRDARVAISYNGEIYNAPSLRRELESLGSRFESRSDTEVILHAYQQWGTRGALTRLQGMFALVIWDTRPTLQGGLPIAVVAGDHAAMKPCFWHFSNGTLSIASTADVARALLDDPPPPDPAALCHVLTLGYCPAPTTVWKGIRKLGPAQYFEWSPGRHAPEVRSWWNPPEARAHEQSLGTRSDAQTGDQTGAEFLELFTRVTNEHLLSDTPVSLLLSGGIDSSAVAAALAHSGVTLPCLTLGLSGDDDESTAAASTAVHLGMPHRTARLDASEIPQLLRTVARDFDEPQGFGALLTMTQVARATRAHGPVVITGDGGDEAFGGYAWHRTSSTTPAASALTRSHLAAIVSQPNATADQRRAALAELATCSPTHAHLVSVMPRFHPAEAAALLAPLSPEYNEETYAAWLAPHDRPGLSPIRRRQRLDLFGFCPGSILPKLDRATMACGLELRAPFLDRRILEWSLSRPESPDESAPAGAKAILRRFLQKRVPPGVLTRPKQGFSLRVPMSDVLGSMLQTVAHSALVTQGVLCPDWRSYLAPDAPNAQGRAFLICALAAWWEERS